MPCRRWQGLLQGGRPGRRQAACGGGRAAQRADVRPGPGIHCADDATASGVLGMQSRAILRLRHHCRGLGPASASRTGAAVQAGPNAEAKAVQWHHDERAGWHLCFAPREVCGRERRGLCQSPSENAPILGAPQPSTPDKTWCVVLKACRGLVLSAISLCRWPAPACHLSTVRLRPCALSTVKVCTDELVRQCTVFGGIAAQHSAEASKSRRA